MSFILSLAYRLIVAVAWGYSLSFVVRQISGIRKHRRNRRRIVSHVRAYTLTH